jgi:hypothetical protein
LQPSAISQSAISPNGGNPGFFGAEEALREATREMISAVSQGPWQRGIRKVFW